MASRYTGFSRTCLFLFSAIVFFFSGVAGHKAAAQQLIINELSQGTVGTQEYVELLVVGTRTCSDSCMDLRNWIIDDHNGWYGATGGMGIATGFMRFPYIPEWSCVPYGSLILIYNDGDKNTSITQADDPTDANHDGVYILPANSSYLEQNATVPVSPSSTSFVYPSTGFIPGGNWTSVGLANAGDAFIVTNPATPGTAHFSITYGAVPNGNVHFAMSGGAVVYYVTGNQYGNATGWTSTTTVGNQTPGAGNSPANTSWINTMRQPGGTGASTSISACINAGQSYNFHGQILTGSGMYTATLTTVTGCDSIITLSLQVIQPNVSQNVYAGCGQVVYNGTTYYNSTSFLDTVLSVGGCDSIYNITAIVVSTGFPYASSDTISGCGVVVNNGISYTSSTLISDTIQNLGGCDSVYLSRYINVMPMPQLTMPADYAICAGTPTTLTANADGFVVWTVGGNPVSTTVQPNTTTTYTATVTNSYGCVNTGNLTIQVQDLQLSLAADDMSIAAGQSVTFVTGANIPYTILSWSPASLFTNQTVQSQVVKPMESVHVTVLAASSAGCTDSASVDVAVYPAIESIIIPNAFSPNGDGLNDTFGPIFVDNFKVIEYRIYNRWGAVVFEGYNGHTRWDGTYRGEPAPLGDYFYILRLEGGDGSIAERKGDVMLVR